MSVLIPDIFDPEVSRDLCLRNEALSPNAIEAMMSPPQSVCKVNRSLIEHAGGALLSSLSQLEATNRSIVERRARVQGSQ